MKILLSLLAFFSLYIQVHSQDLEIPDNPYDSAEEFVKKRNSFKRERWFYEQRMYPNNFIPDGAYQKAMEEKMALREQNGFYSDVANTWVSLGPSPGAYSNWNNISSRMATVKYDPVNPSIIYIGAAFGGVWKSTNGGANWVAKTDNEVSLSSGSIAIDPANTNIIYYGTGEATYSAASYYGRGILKSTNGGTTWTNYTTGLPSQTFSSRIVIRPGNPSQIFLAAGVNGLYKSLDAGVTWTQAVSGRCDDIVFSPAGDKAYIVGSGTGYRISTDGGVTFTSNSSVTMGTRNHMAICKATPSVLYIAVYTGSSINVFKSTNSGTNFSQVAVGTNFNGGQAWYDFYMHVNQFNPDIAYVGSVDTWRTTNGGTSFQNITNGYSTGNVHVDQQNMDMHPTNPQELLAVNDGGIWKSTNQGTNWINLNTDLTLTQFYRIASDYSNASHIMGGTQDNGTQRTLGTAAWTGAFGGDGGEVCFDPNNPLYILGETQNNGVQRSINGGASWSNATSGLTGSGSWVAPILAHPDSSGVFYTARGQVFKSTNIGASWVGISTGTSGTIREMAISQSNPSVMFATSGASVYRSTNRGYTFTNVTSGLPGRTITSVNIHPDSSNVAILTFSGFGAGKMYKTTNGGTNWINVSGNLPDSPANDGLIYYPGISTRVYFIAMDIGVFMTNNYGNTWVELADGLPNTVAMHLDYNPAANKLRIGTHGRGVFELTSLTAIASQQGSEIPSQFRLSQNYPNPFNPSTTISYNIAKKEMVTLKVFDMMGQEVSTLVNRVNDAGSYEIVFNAVNLSSGVYFYKLETSSFSDTKKMIIVK